MKPLFSSDDEAKAASAVPVAPLAPLLNPSGTSDMLPASRPEASAAPLVRIDVSAIDDAGLPRADLEHRYRGGRSSSIERRLR